MPLTLRATGLGSGIAKDRPDYTVVAGEWEVRRIYEKRMIAGRQACFCEALRSLVIASSRSRTDRVIVMETAPDSHGNRNRGIPNQDSSVRQRPLV